MDTDEQAITFGCRTLLNTGGQCYCRRCSERKCKDYITIPSIKQILSPTQREDHDRRIEIVRTNISRGASALVLGAGVSISSGMPGWVGLISEMFGYAIDYAIFAPNDEPEEKDRIIRLIRALNDKKLFLLSNVNALESAQYVAQLFNNPGYPATINHQLPAIGMKSILHRMVTNSLTSETLLKRTIGDEKRADELLEELKANRNEKLMREVAGKQTLFAVSYLLSKSAGLNRAITYNYDPLVQECMMDIFGVAKTDIITHPGMWNNPEGAEGKNRKEIYHVHGFVKGARHEDLEKGTVYPEDSDSIVLSEDSYYQMEQNEAYDWSSSIQAFFLNKFSCLFVGFSAEDYNFRRILRQLGAKDPKLSSDQKHYLILAVDDWVKNTYEDICHYRLQNHLPGNPSETMRDTVTIVRQILRCKEKYWERYPIRPIWVTVKEIAKLLAGLV